MNIFLTGGTGFIGSHFLNSCLQNGFKVYAVKREGSIPRTDLSKQPIWIEGDLNSDFKEFLIDTDVLVHFAAHSANVPYDTLEKCIYWNVTASLKLIRQAIDAGVSKFIIAGSCFEYGRSAQRYEFIPVDAPLEPFQTYPISKAMASIAISGLAMSHNLQLQILRIFQVFGEGEASSRLWPSLKRAAEDGEDFPLTMGEQLRDFIYVRDLVDIFLKAMEFNNIDAGVPVIRNVGGGNPQSVREFAEFWWRKWDAKGKIEYGKIPYRSNEIMRYVPLIQNSY